MIRNKTTPDGEAYEVTLKEHKHWKWRIEKVAPKWWCVQKYFNREMIDAPKYYRSKANCVAFIGKQSLKHPNFL